MKKKLWKKFTVPLAAASMLLPITTTEAYAQTSDVKDSAITNTADQPSNEPAADSNSTNPSKDTIQDDVSVPKKDSEQNQTTPSNDTNPTNHPSNDTSDTNEADQTPSEGNQSSGSNTKDETDQNSDTTKPLGEDTSSESANNDKEPNSQPDDSAETPDSPNTPPSDVPTDNQSGTTDDSKKPDNKPNHNTDNQGGSSSSHQDDNQPKPNHHESQDGQSKPGNINSGENTSQQNNSNSSANHSQQSNTNGQLQNQSTSNIPSYQSRTSNWENHLNGLTQKAANQPTNSNGYMVPFTKMSLSSERFGHLVSGALKYNPYIIDQVSHLSEDEGTTSADVDAMLKPRHFASNAELNQLQQNTGYFKYQYFNLQYAQDYYDNLDLQILGLVTGEIGSMSDLKVNNHKVHHTNHASESKTNVNKKVNKENEHEKAKSGEKHHLRYSRLLTSVIVAFGVVFIGFLGLWLMKRNKKNEED